MEVKAGYRQTEVGVIPEDWEVNSCLNLCIKIQDGTHFSPRIGGNDFLYFTSKNIKFGYLDITNIETIDSQQHREIYRRCDVKYGDILLTKDGANTGNAAINNITEEFSILSSVAFLRIDASQYVANYFLQQILSFGGQQRIKEAMSGNAITRLTLEKIRKIKFATPSFPEQTAIATALSDTDALISSLEKLIAKKKLVKQGAMQALLTGKKRLPGFTKDWAIKALGEIGEISGSGVDKKIRTGEVSVRLVNYLDVFHKDFIYSADLSHWVTAPNNKLQRCQVLKGDIFFTPSSEMRFDIAISAVAMEDILDATYSYHLVRLRLNEDWELKFRTYIFKIKDFIDQAETICEGSGKRYVISLTKFRNMTISYPPDKKEQKAISEILFDIDSEIFVLENKLGKYKMIKLGMMNELLTGRIRLI
jgi:type I restriction enzyme S subunit